MLAKIRSGFLHPKTGGTGSAAGNASSSSSSSPAITSKEVHGGKVVHPGGEQLEQFDEPLPPNYLHQTQEEKLQAQHRAAGRSPVLARRAGSASSQDSPRTQKGERPSLDVPYPGESSLDSPGMSRARTLPVGSNYPHRAAPQPSLPAASSSSRIDQVRGDAVADPSGEDVQSSAFRRKQRDLRTLPAAAPTDAPQKASRGGVDDDYVDPFDARLRIAMRGEETSPPIIRAAGNGVSGKPSTGSKLSSCSSKQSSSSLRKEPVDMYEDPYDARRQKPSLAKEPSDTYEDPFDTAARNKRFSPPSQASDADSGVYNQPHDIKGAGLLPPCSSEEGNYMDPFDAKKPKKVSPMPIRKVSKSSRVMDPAHLPPTSSEHGNYSQPFDFSRNNGKSTSSMSSRPSTSSQPDRLKAHRTISVPEVLIDAKAALEKSDDNYVLPHDAILRQGRSGNSPAVSPAVRRSPSSERTPSDRSSLDGGSRPGSTNISRSNSGRSLPAHDDGVIVDVTMPLDEQPWYHGALRRDDAERRLMGAGDGSFIIRQSESCLTDFSMSLRNHQETMHLKINRRTKDNRYVLGMNSRPFKSIQEMILYYTKNNLPIRGAEHISLVHGVSRTSAIYANVGQLRS